LPRGQARVIRIPVADPLLAENLFLGKHVNGF
jgi:hypothetical protein